MMNTRVRVLSLLLAIVHIVLGADIHHHDDELNINRTFQVHKIIPNSGLVDGGTNVLIIGDHIVDTHDISCTFGDSKVKGRWISHTEVECISPAHVHHQNDVVNVSLVVNDMKYSPPIPFSYYVNPTITQISPEFGPSTGGTLMTVVVDKIIDPTDDLVCKFDSRQVTGVYLNSTSLYCQVPPGIVHTTVQVRMSRNGGHDFSSTSNSSTFQYITTPTITSVSPLFTSVKGGILKIFGKSFRHSGINVMNDFKCWFGGGVNQSSPISFISNQELRCLIPSVTVPEIVELRIAVDVISQPRFVTMFEFHKEAEVTSINPSIGPDHGRIQVDIHGKNFYETDTIYCRFGSVDVKGQFVTTKVISCIVPPNSYSYEEPVVPVAISFDGGETFLPTYLNFTYSITGEKSASQINQLNSQESKYRLHIRHLEPSFCLKHKDFSLSVTIDNLIEDEDYVCMFESYNTSALFKNSTHIFCRCPDEISASMVQMSIGRRENGLIHKEANSIQIQILNAPIIKDVYFLRSNSTGILISVVGDEFYNATSLKCVFDGNQAFQVKWISRFQVECNAPDFFRWFNLEVNDMVSSDVLKIEQMVGYSVVSTVIQSEDALDMIVSGEGLRQDFNLTCAFDSFHTKLVYRNKYDFSCQIPINFQGLQFRFRIYKDMLDVVYDSTFAARSAATVERIWPLYGSIAGGTRVTIKMVVNVQSRLRCAFGDRVLDAIREVDQSWSCTSPPMLKPATEIFGLLKDGPLPIFQSTFTFLANAEITRIEPSNLLHGKSSAIRLYGFNFPNVKDLYCIFDDIASARAVWKSNSEVSCVVPQMKNVGSVNTWISFGNNDTTLTSKRIYIDYPVKLNSVDPCCGPSGTTIKLYGTNLQFNKHPYCHFGISVVRAKSMDSSSIQCEVPYLNQPGNVTIAISKNGLNTFESTLQFTLEDEASIHNIQPNFIDKDRKNFTIQVNGSRFRFRERTQCKIGKFTSNNVMLIDDTSILCSFDTLDEVGTFPVTLQDHTTVISSKSVLISVSETPQILSLSPKLIHGYQEELLMIEGSNFASIQLKLLIRNSLIDRCTVLDPNHASCFLPPLRVGTYEIRLSNDGIIVSQSAQSIIVMHRVKVTSLSPPSGMVDTPIIVCGTNFQAPLYCVFEEDFSVKARVINATMLECIVPPLRQTGVVSISLAIDGLKTIHHHMNFTVLEMSIASVSPAIGSVDGRTSVTVTLERGQAKDISSCMFGDMPVRATLISSTSVVCVSPPVQSPQIIAVEVSSNGKDSTRNNRVFEYVKPIRLFEIEPQSGSESGGTKISLRGANIPQSSRLQCWFGDVKVKARWVSNTEATCISVPLKPGVYELTLSLDNLDKDRVFALFHVYQIQTMNSFTPIVRSLDGLMKFSIFGTNFLLSQNLFCRLGDAVIKAALISSNEIWCWTPQLTNPPLHSHDVSISTNGADFLSTTNNFQFQVQQNNFQSSDDYDKSEIDEAGIGIPQKELIPIVVKSISPSTVIIQNPSVIRILGHGFHHSVHSLHQIFYKNDEFHSIKARVINATMLECIFPPLRQTGVVSISLVIDGLKTIHHHMNFTVLEMSIASVSPAIGSVDGGTSVTVTLERGQAKDISSCMFGDMPVRATLISSTSVVCVSPPVQSPQIIAVEVSSNGKDSTRNNRVFEYVKPIRLFEIEPQSGSESGGTKISLRGANIPQSSRLQCWFGDVKVKARWVSNTEATCISVPLKPGVYELNLSVNQLKENVSFSHFIVYAKLSVHHVSKLRFEHLHTMDHFVVYGSNFFPSPRMLCRFNGIPVAATYIENNGVSCSIPHHNGPNKDISFGLCLNGDDFDMSKEIKRAQPPTISNITPQFGSIKGGTVISVKYKFAGIKSRCLCDFNGIVRNATICDSTEVQCISPPSNVNEEAKFMISLDDGFHWSNSLSFSYKSASKINLIQPDSGPSKGGQLISLFGENFHHHVASHLHCRFGDLISNHTMVVSNIEIRCVAPSHPMGTISVVVLIDSEEEIPSKDLKYTFFTNPQLIYSHPRSWDASKATALHIHGKDFHLSFRAKCSFEDYEILITLIGTNILVCKSPMNPYASKSFYSIIDPDLDFLWQPLIHEFMLTPKLHMLPSAFGSSKQNFTLTVYGENFDSTGTTNCHFYLPMEEKTFVTTKATVLNGTCVNCVVPNYDRFASNKNIDVAVSNNGVNWSNGRLRFEYIVTPVILLISPISTTVDGGTEVSIVGSGFIFKHGEMKCNFGPYIVSARRISDSKIQCNCPQVLKPTLLPLSVQFSNNEIFYSGLDFEFFKRCSVLKVSPSMGVATGGTKVVFEGQFHSEKIASVFCKFGSTYVTGKIIDMNNVLCISPPNKVGKSKLSLFLNDRRRVECVHQKDFNFTYVSNYTVLETQPKIIPVGISTSILLTGYNFTEDSIVRCSVQGIETQAKFQSKNAMICNIPPIQLPGILPFLVKVEDYEILKDIRVTKNAIITEVAPRFINAGSSVLMNVEGENFFESTDLKCSFGSNRLSDAVWLSSSLIQCRSPILEVGPLSFAVSNNQGNHFSNSIYLQVQSAMQILSTSQMKSFTTGGSLVVVEIRASSIPYEGLCLFSNIGVNITLKMKAGSHTIRCRAPEHSEGVVDLSFKFGSETVFIGKFTFINPPNVSKIHPNHGMSRGGTMLTIEGTGFHGATTCKFLRYDRPDHPKIQTRIFTISNSSAIKCPVPSILVTKSDFVNLELEYEWNATIPLIDYFFSYEDTPRVFSISQISGPEYGGTKIEIHGENFIDSMELKCRFGDKDVVGFYRTMTKMECFSPKSSIGWKRLSVSTNGVDFHRSKFSFFYYPAPTIINIDPPHGPKEGGTPVTITLINGYKSAKISCRFGSTIVQAMFLKFNEVVCYSPVVPVAKTLPLTLSFNGQDYHGCYSKCFYEFLPPIRVEKINPAIGRDASDVSIEISGVHKKSILRNIVCHFGQENIVIPKHIELNNITCVAPIPSYGIRQYPISVKYNITSNDYNYAGPLYYYIEAVAILKVEPKIGSINGGTIVHLSGINFPKQIGLFCRFGDIRVDSQFVNHHQIICKTPPMDRPQVVSLDLITNDHPKSMSISSSSFEFIAHPSIHSSYPESGSSIGGTKVTVKGNNFSPELTETITCRFGTTMILGKFENPQEVTCRSPPKDPSLLFHQNVALSISMNGQDFVSSKNASFSYFEPIRVVQINPDSGPISGGSIVTVTLVLSRFLEAKHLSCYFGNFEHQATFLTREKDFVKISCISPSVSSRHNKLSLEVGGRNGNDISRSNKYFKFYSNPILAQINPISGFPNGGNVVTITGRGFQKDPNMVCSFNDITSPKVTFISHTRVLCIAPSVKLNNMKVLEAPVKLALNGRNFGPTNITYRYTDFPAVKRIDPQIAKSDGSTIIHIGGTSLSEAKTCRFGKFGEPVRLLTISNDVISCRAPKITMSSPYNTERAEIYVGFFHGFVKFGHSITYNNEIEPSQIYNETFEDILSFPFITTIKPAFSSSQGGQPVLILGENFVNGKELGCLFGEKLQTARFISSFAIECRSPQMIPGHVMLNIINGRSGLKSKFGKSFEIVEDIVIHSINPRSGPMKGGSRIVIHGKFPTLRQSQITLSSFCLFGATKVPATFLSPKSLQCLSPPTLHTNAVQLKVSLNGDQFSHSFHWFSYYNTPQVVRLNPNHGNLVGGYYLLIEGVNFMKTTELKCRFANTDSIQAVFLSTTQILCLSPSWSHAVTVPIELSFNGYDYTNSYTLFQYHPEIQVESIWPSSSPALVVSNVVYLKGKRFPHEFKLLCIFSQLIISAELVDEETVICRPPTLFPDFKNVQLVGYSRSSSSNVLTHQFYASPLISTLSSNFGNIQGTMPLLLFGRNFVNNTLSRCNFSGKDMKSIYINDGMTMCFTPPTIQNEDMSIQLSPSNADYAVLNERMFEFKGNCEQGKYCGFSTISWVQNAPNGTHVLSADTFNFTLCKPGTFAPTQGLLECLPCPVAYICPDFGMTKPIICPSGKVCDTSGLSLPVDTCPPGHYCPFGTKTYSPFTFKNDTRWFEDNVTGEYFFDVNFSLETQVKKRLNPEAGSFSSRHEPTKNQLKAEQPIPCPLGYYCLEGVATNISTNANFSTPQPCYNGHFCPRGSFIPEGNGPCPSGYYCPTESLAIICPLGHYCPGVANTEPIECYPGSYSPTVGSNRCQECDIGFICPTIGLNEPDPCPAGFVCDTTGLSQPSVMCPPGYYCKVGTMTTDPFHPSHVTPLPCPDGVYCLGGIAHDTTIEWLPTQMEGRFAPQRCTEGYYCGKASKSKEGDGPCFSGHYCPPGTSYPIEVPMGTYSDEGAIVPVLCFPGTYSANTGSSSCQVCPSGHSCIGYGTYIPKVCDVGTYRSKADSITCKFCPEGTFLPHRGATDITQCLPCPAGLVCEKTGMSSLIYSELCEGGHICSSSTDKTNQYKQRCPSGHVCKKGTIPEFQFTHSCGIGQFCFRGTSWLVRQKNLCEKSQYCPIGSPNALNNLNHCPRQTTTRRGAWTVQNCTIQPVDICDKQRVNPQISTMLQSYYPHHKYTTLDSNEVREISKNILQSKQVEVKVLRKVMPINVTASSNFWVNDTIEVFRSCPEFLDSSQYHQFENKGFFIIGKNFQNTSSLSCRFRMKYDDGQYQYFVQNAEFIGTNKIRCALPDYTNNTIFISPQDNKYCAYDDDERLYYRRPCSSQRKAKCMGSFLKNDRHERFYSLFVPCSESQAKCSDIPSIGFDLNPCFSSTLIVDVTNNGEKFSSNETFIPYSVVGANRKSLVVRSTESTFTVLQLNTIKSVPKPQQLHLKKMISNLYKSHDSKCSQKVASEEAAMQSEVGWFMLPFMSQAKISINWTHLPSYVKYNEHFKFAMFAQPSRCSYAFCNEARERQPDSEAFPCSQPLNLPQWFQNTSVDKHQMLNLTVLALDDVIIKPEIHLLYGVFLPLSDIFLNTITVQIEKPLRTRIHSNDEIERDTFATRSLSPHVSWEEKLTPMEHIFVSHISNEETRSVSMPLNLPPRWKEFEKGRLLLSMNTSHESNTPSVLDDEKVVKRSNTFWENPFPSVITAKENTDAYWESFHGLFIDENGEYGYQMKDLMLPYFPYFSNCREFDSFVPISHVLESYQCSLPESSVKFPLDWWRRNHSALPHRDYITAVGPFDFYTFYPVADWCERKMHCNFEEALHEPDVVPRWFEADTGTKLFSLIRDPVNYFEYTGREKVVTGFNDGGGSKFINSIELSDTFIPVKVKRNGSGKDCKKLCFPRLVTLDLSYHQVNLTNKRIIEAIITLDKFDTDMENSNYEFDLKFYPLNYQELIVKFAFSRDIFLILFSLIGAFTVVTSFCYWCLVRLTTQIRNPPPLRIGSMLWLMFPQAISGFTLGLVPITLVTGCIVILMKEDLFIKSLLYNHGIDVPSFSQFRLHYKDVAINPDLDIITRQGRLGIAFVAIALVSFTEGSKLFVPQRLSKHERDLDLGRDDDAKKTKLWNIVNWKRSNLILCSIFMGLLSTVIVEWSYWASFGTYIWEAIIFLKIVDNLISNVVDWQTGEVLLSAPIMTSFGLIQGIVTLSANDFLDFLLSYIVGFGFLLLERMYISPFQGQLIDSLGKTLSFIRHKIIQWFKFVWGNNLKNQNETELQQNSDEAPPEGTVEPIIESYGSYCLETVSLLYIPYAIIFLTIFRDDTEIPNRYGIKEKDMEYYAVFAIMIIPFQFIADAFIHSSLELFHGWKIYDYLVYTRYRFLQRETKWKGLEDSLDECIEESVRTMDHMCFSSQFYMMTTIHVNGILYMVFGIQMISRAKHNLFGDPAMPLILGLVIVICFIVKQIVLFLAWALNLWRIRHENTAWHVKVAEEDTFRIPDWDGIRGASVDAFEMNKRISSESFRHKFLTYNKAWLIEQLPNILTPRTIQRSKPFLTNQLARVIHKLNSDSSSDDEYNREPTFEVPQLSSGAKSLMKSWLNEAQRIVKLRECVQPMIERARATHCERCLCQKSLKVQTKFSIEQMDSWFKEKYTSIECNDYALWKQFWHQNQKYNTICLPCIASERERDRKAPPAPPHPSKENTIHWDAVMLKNPSEVILSNWYRSAHKNVFGSKGKKRKQQYSGDISDDNDEDFAQQKWIQLHPNEIPKSTSNIATFWLRSARAKLQRNRQPDET